MQRIVAPLNAGERGPNAANLIQALLFFVDQRVITPSDGPVGVTAEELRALAALSRLELATQSFGDGTQLLLGHFQSQHVQGTSRDRVDEVTAERMNGFLRTLGALDGATVHVVRGTIRDASGLALPGVIVRAFDRDVRRVELLGQDSTNERGEFEIPYTAKMFARAERGGVDLQVRAYDSAALDRVLAESDVRFNAGPQNIVDLTVATGQADVPSEFEAYVAALQPLLRGQADEGGNLAIADLKDRDVVFLSREAEIDASRLAHLAAAHRIGAKLGGERAIAACYGWGRKGIGVDVAAFRRQPPSELRRVLLEAADERIVPASIRDSVDDIIASIGHEEWRAVTALLAQMRLPDGVAQVVSSRVDAIESIDDSALRGLVGGGALDQAQADRLGLAASIHRATDGNLDAINIAFARKWEALGNRSLRRSEDLARLGAADWAELLNDSRASIPEGETVESIAEGLEEAALGAYPTIGFLFRVLREPVDVSRHLADLEPRTRVLKRLWTMPIASAEAAAIVKKLPEEQQAAFATARETAHRFPGLKSQALTLARLDEAVKSVASDLATVAGLNPDLDLLSLDLSTDSPDLGRIALGSLDEVQSRGVMTQLRGMQRVLAAAEHPLRAYRLMGAGYHHLTTIAIATQAELVERAGLTPEEAALVHDRAQTGSLQAVHAWMAVRDVQSEPMLLRGSGAMAMARSSAAQIARWSDLFGFADSCHCDHCQSVLSPAAYFVDLMHYVERFILAPSAGVPAEAQLVTRRGDLWTEPLLSCKSTDEIVPTLDIVNRLLEKWITVKKPQWQTPFQIYSNLSVTDVANPSFALPVNFPIERLEILLAHFGLSRDRIAQALGVAAAARIDTRLRTWSDERSLIEDDFPDNASAGSYFEQLYQSGGIVVPNGPGRLDQLIGSQSLTWLQNATQLDRDVVRALVRSRFVSADGSNVPAVAVTLTARPGDVQNTTEEVANLTRRRLDRLHRLTRLWKRLPWTVPELDYVIGRITPTNTVADLTEPRLRRIVDLLDVCDSTGLAIEEVMALADDLPRQGFKGRPSLFDRRFNADPFVVRGGSWPNTMPADLPLPVAGAPAAGADSSGARLLAALNMSDRDFSELIESLLAAPGLVTVAAGVPTSLHLSAPSLAILYRHATLAKVFKLRPRELMRLVRLTPEIAGRPAADAIVKDLADVVAVQRFVLWQRGSKYSPEDVSWIRDAATRPASEPSAADVATRVVERIGRDRLVTFPATIFTGVAFTEAQSRLVTASLEGRAVEQTVAGATAPAALQSAPDEVEYRVKRAVTDAALAGFIASAVEPWTFDVAETAVFALARRLAEFESTVFTALFLSAAVSTDLVTQNLDDGVEANPRRPFVEFTNDAGDTRYRANPAYFALPVREPLVIPSDQAGNPINLAGTIVLGFLQKTLAATGARASTSRAVAETIFTEIGLSEQQSRWLVALNPAISTDATAATAFLDNPSGEGLVLNEKASGNSASRPDLRDPLKGIKPRAASLLRSFDPLIVADRILAAELSLDGAVVTALHGFRPPVQAIDPRELFGDVTSLTTLTAAAGQLQRLKRLFNPARFNADAVRTVVTNWTTAFAGQAGDAIDDTRLQAIAAYGRWLPIVADDLDVAPAAEQTAKRAAFHRLVAANGQFGNALNADLALVLNASEAEVRGLKEIPGLWQGVWHGQLDRARIALEMSRRLGVGGRTIARIAGLDTAAPLIDALWKAADDIYASFRAKYPGDATYREKSEAFEDLIRSQRRDALVAYVSTTSTQPVLRTGADFLSYFLMDVEAGGCARTSRLVAAISSVQLFVHRVLMGLEAAAFGTSPDAVDARNQWYWRKHYRVWEANRKVFLFPENFIEPDLRDDKTPLFGSLEGELLQRRITNVEAEESYATYLSGYSEVAGVKIVGAFHDVVRGTDIGLVNNHEIFTDALHLVGVTADDPPVHYIRRIDNLLRSKTNALKYPLQFSPWRKVTAQIPARWVSPVVHHRKLMLFWVEIATVSTTSKVEGESWFSGYQHKFKVKWIAQRTNGSWTGAQEGTFLDPDGNVRRSYVDQLAFVLAPDVPATVTRNQTGPNAPPGGELVPFTVPSPARKEALPVLEDGQADATTEVSLGTVEEPDGHGGVEHLPVSETVRFRAAPRSQPQTWALMRHHGAAIDDFTVSGWNWERAFPTTRHVGASQDDDLQVAAMNSDVHGFLREPERRISFTAYAAIQTGAGGLLSAHSVRGFMASGANLVQPQDFSPHPTGHHIWYATSDLLSGASPGPNPTVVAGFGSRVTDGVIVNARAEAAIPNTTVEAFRPSCIVQSGTLHALVINNATGHRFVNLSTTTGLDLVRQLARGSVNGLLDREFQRTLQEKLTTVTLGTGVESVKSTAFDFRGAYGTYLREVFFHIPFLVAHHLNSQQRFEDAQRWYHYIFNPMPQDGSVWRYREFNGLPVHSMREALKDPAALAVYRNDPFNPHAIARLRLSAYQRSIVMKYIDNLLDWGDSLFTQFTMESVNEAMMLYILAADILGERPNTLPKCMEDHERSYNDVKPSLSEVSDFLIEEMEQVTLVIPRGSGNTIYFNGTTRRAAQPAPMMARFAMFGDGFTPPGGEGGGGSGFGVPGGYWTSTGGTPLESLYNGRTLQVAAGDQAVGGRSGRMLTTPPIDFVPEGTGIDTGIFGTKFELGPPGFTGVNVVPGLLDVKYTLNDAPPPYREVLEDPPPKVNVAEYVPARSIFCFPINRDFLAYHDRVQDRLFKIRNCMDIAGVRRQLALFAPEIDPRLLVRAKAAGLTLEEVLDVTSGHAPPYRFTVLIAKAREYAATVQNLGSQLLATLEKRDAEELASLRTMHEQHLLDMRTQMMRWELDAANDALSSVERQREAAELRRDHYQGLISGGLIASESAQQMYTQLAAGLGIMSSTVDMVAAIAGLIPQVHTPTMAGAEAETGGLTAANVLARISSSTRAASSVFDWASRSSGVQASFDRRAQEWKLQVDLAKKDMAQLDRLVKAAQFRVSIAERAAEVHHLSIEQAREVFELYRTKFTSLGLYTWMSTQLYRLHRLAFDTAWSMARMAESALHFERPELRGTSTLTNPSWANDRAGLLAGEMLGMELQRMEASYLQTNTRQVEVEQSFSLARYSPGTLIALQENGTCDFDIPELFFDLHYPGHYFRRIKAVRLSLPCVVGPHTSVGATLRMTGSRLRETADATQALAEVPLRHAPVLVASTAQNDAGVFDFNFRDDRLLPFEGMGAISSWTLRLPQSVRPFDYRTISDVILRVSYTAREDDGLRAAVDSGTGAIVTRVQEAAPTVALSVRHDCPEVWAKFKQGPRVNGRCVADLLLTESSYPWWLRGRLKTGEDVTVHALFDGAGGALDAVVGTLPQADLDKEETPTSENAWYSSMFAGAKPEAAAAAAARTLALSFSRNDMADVVIVLSPSQ